MSIPIHIAKTPPPPSRIPALLSYGFRVFFLCTAVWGVAATAILLAGLTGWALWEMPRPLVAWHAHEMLYGFAGAGIAGFLLTAVPAWTNRPRVQGWPLLGLLVLWVAGRLLNTLWIGAPPSTVAAVDLTFLTLILVVSLKSIALAGNKRNLPVMGVVAIIAVGCLVSHVGAAAESVEAEALGTHLGLYGLAFLIVVIGGRIVPNFTGNWMARTGKEGEPAPFGPFDKGVLAVTAAASLADTFWTSSPLSGGLLLLAAGLNIVRLCRWQGYRTLGDPMVWVLHLGYLWLAVGYAHLGASALTDMVPRLAGVHALAAGAIGTMLLAVMSRASLGHTGRALQADAATVVCYVLVTIAALARLTAAWLPELWAEMLTVSAAAWIAAFGLFTIRYLPIWLSPRAS